MNKDLAAVLLTVGLMLPCMAHADVFYFHYSGDGVSAAGTITALSTPTVGEWSISDVTGSRNGSSITFVPGSNASFNADDLLIFPKNPDYLSLSTCCSGFIIQTADGQFNPYQGGGQYFESQVPGNYNPGTPIDFTVSSVPEPTSILLMGTLMLGIAGTLKRKLL